MVDFQEVIGNLVARGWTYGRLAQKTGGSAGAIRALHEGRNSEPRYALGASLVELERRTRKRK